MKTPAQYFLVITLAFFSRHAIAQKDNKAYMQKAPTAARIDGELKEWGDSLAYYDSKTKMNYTIANDDTDMYVIARVTDPQMKRKIMAGGITISVNPEGKKHKTYSMTYPVPDASAMLMARANNEENAEEMYKPSLLQTTSIKVAGFKDVESEVITTANTYGFKAAVKFDDKHTLVYETAIPLKMLDIKPGKNAEFAINIQVNGIQRPEKKNNGSGMEGMGGGRGGGMGGGGMGGMGGGGRGGRGGGRGGAGGQQGEQTRTNQQGMGEDTDFWISLAPVH